MFTDYRVPGLSNMLVVRFKRVRLVDQLQRQSDSLVVGEEAS